MRWQHLMRAFSEWLMNSKSFVYTQKLVWHAKKIYFLFVNLNRSQWYCSFIVGKQCWHYYTRHLWQNSMWFYYCEKYVAVKLIKYFIFYTNVQLFLDPKDIQPILKCWVLDESNCSMDTFTFHFSLVDSNF